MEGAEHFIRQKYPLPYSLMMILRHYRQLILLIGTVLLLQGTARSEDRPYFMGTTPFFASLNSFPDWRFENMDDKDLISLHADDFLGIPWENFMTGSAPPTDWTAKWENLANSAAASGKPIYVSLAPLGGGTGRRSLTVGVDGTGNKSAENWATPVDSSGCYVFSDPGAEAYKQAYIRYCRYVIDLTHPRYFSPAIELSVSYTACPSQQSAMNNWYRDVHSSLKSAYPALIIFPTFQMEHMYGLVGGSACGNGMSRDACYEQRLREALAVPADRLAFSMYPNLWKFLGETVQQHDPFALAQSLTTKKIWVAETGWAAVRIPNPSDCSDLFPASIANNAIQDEYMTWLLGEAQTRGFEGVVWWLNRDFLDGPTAATCPCTGDTETCQFLAAFNAAGGASGELLLRMNANMALYEYDGTPRPALTTWQIALAQPRLTSVPSSPSNAIAYPNPFFPGKGQGGIAIVDVPANASLSIYAVTGTLVRALHADSFGTAQWDGKNEEGRPVASGVYFAFIQGAEENKTLKIVVQR